MKNVKNKKTVNINRVNTLNSKIKKTLKKMKFSNTSKLSFFQSKLKNRNFMYFRVETTFEAVRKKRKK